MALNRRDVLRYGATTALTTVAAGVMPIGSAANATSITDAAQIVAAYRQLQIGQNRVSPLRNQALAALDQVAISYNATMNVASTQLWTDLPTGPGSTYFPLMYYRLRTIAVDYATPGSALSTVPGMLQRILTALDTLYYNQYNENTAEIGNWYQYEIGGPYWLLQIIVALGAQLPAAQMQRVLLPVLRFVADPNMRTATPGLIETGANRADKAFITVLSGALVGDSNRIATGLAAVTDQAGGGANSLVARVTVSDGYHTDGSFIQHATVPYTGHYALVLLSAAAGLLYVTAGTGSQLAPQVRDDFVATITDVYAPFLFTGSMMEPVRGRMLSRQGETGHDAGHQLIAATVLLASTVPAPASTQLAGLAAKWIAEGTWAPYLRVSDVIRFAGGLQAVGVPEVEFAEQLLAVEPPQPHSVPVHRTFPQMDRVVHVTEKWSASLGISSTRICRYESINGQNLHGWYVGDGVLYTFLDDQQGHYSDAYWPTVDATLLPGSTEKNRTQPALLVTPPLTTTAFAGGVRFDDRRGVHGLDFVSQDGTLAARKSWFFTPDAVLCLGAGITDASGAQVFTTIENRNLGEDGTGTLLVDGLPSTAPLGQTVVLNGTNWLHLHGVGGYVLLDGSRQTAVTLLREDRTGTWLSIDTGATTHGTNVPYTRRYQKILLDHGANPAGAEYAYAVLPRASADRTREARWRWRVLANTTAVQAVQLDDGVTGAAWYAAGVVDGVTVSGPAAAMWGRTRDGWALAVSDPTQLQSVIRVTVDRAVRRVVQADPTVTVIATAPQLVVDINVASSLGATHTLVVL